jgi:hypothetical protein
MIVAHSRDGSQADTLGVGYATERFLSGDRVWGSPLVPRNPYVAIGSDFLVHGDGDASEILVLGLRRDTLATIPLPFIGGETVNRLASARREARLAAVARGRRARSRAVLETIPVPDSVADISALSVDALDQIWVGRIPFPQDSVTRWDVYDRSGTHVAWIMIPSTWTVREIREESILATDRDEYDVSLILIHQILR